MDMSFSVYILVQQHLAEILRDYEQNSQDLPFRDPESDAVPIQPNTYIKNSKCHHEETTKKKKKIMNLH